MSWSFPSLASTPTRIVPTKTWTAPRTSWLSGLSPWSLPLFLSIFAHYFALEDLWDNQPENHSFWGSVGVTGKTPKPTHPFSYPLHTIFTPKLYSINDDDDNPGSSSYYFKLISHNSSQLERSNFWKNDKIYLFDCGFEIFISKGRKAKDSDVAYSRTQAARVSSMPITKPVFPTYHRPLPISTLLHKRFFSDHKTGMEDSILTNACLVFMNFVF